MRELEFFGEVTAGVTHQLKNELAVINETGNLIVEILAMAEQGLEFDPDRIKALAQRVVDRVERSNGMLKRLNAFAHSAEAEIPRADVIRTLRLMVSLYERNAGFKKVSLALEPLPEETPLEVRVRPILLEQILWASLEEAIKAAPSGSQVKASLTQSEGEIFLRFSGELGGDLVAPSRELLAQGAVTETVEAGALCLKLPS